MVQDEVSRINGLRFCGVWHTREGDLALFEDSAGTRTSFTLRTGETLGDAMQRVSDRYKL